MFYSVTFYYEDYYSIYFVRRDDDRGNYNYNDKNNYLLPFPQSFSILRVSLLRMITCLLEDQSEDIRSSNQSVFAINGNKKWSDVDTKYSHTSIFIKQFLLKILLWSDYKKLLLWKNNINIDFVSLTGNLFSCKCRELNLIFYKKVSLLSNLL